MTTDEARKVVYDVAARQLGEKVREMPPDTRLADLEGDNLVDSLDLVEMVMAIEDEIGEEISDETAGEWVTVSNVIAYVAARDR